ncbi:MAG: sulfotransferase [Pseudomonadota bacterium]
MLTTTQTRSARQWFEEGEAQLKDGKLQNALDAYRKSLKLNPRAAAAWVGLSKVLEANQQPRDALECLKRGAAAEPGNAAVLSRLARSHAGLGQVDAAKAVYEKALARDPQSISSRTGLGQLLEDMGDPEGAAASYRKVLELKPGDSFALANLLELGRHVDISIEIADARRRLITAEDKDAAAIGYGLGKALEQEADYDAAFAAFKAANDARRRLTGAFDEAVFKARVDQLIALFNEDFFKARVGWGDPSQQPVFIVGLPRSGTTLTEQILGSHPACFGAGELAILTDLTTGTPDRLKNPDTVWPQCAPDLSASDLAHLGADYVRQSAALAPGNPRYVIDKQPLNFWHLPMVAMAMPNARIIQCERDIRDIGLSIYSQNFNPSQRWATDLADIGAYWQGYQRLMQHVSTVTGLKILKIRYEDTVDTLETQVQSLLGFLELEWDDALLTFHENTRAVQTPSRWQVRQPLYTGSKGKWQRYRKHLAPLITVAAQG